MHRTTIYLAQAQMNGLAHASQEIGLTQSALIRIAINELIARRKRQGKKRE